MQTFSIKDLLQLESGNVIDILYAISVTQNKKEIRWLLDQGAIKVDGVKISENLEIIPINNLGVIIKACNRIFIKIN